MTREQAKAALPIIQAFAEGKEMQWRQMEEMDEWCDLETLGSWIFERPGCYRVKPPKPRRVLVSENELYKLAHAYYTNDTKLIELVEVVK